MMRLKGCPKCSGDVLIEEDEWGWYEQCLQCSFLRDLPDTTGVKTPLPRNEGGKLPELRIAIVPGKKTIATKTA